MNYFLTENVVLKRLETPTVYHIEKDDLYELDDESFEFLRKCASKSGCNSDDKEFIDYCLKEGILTTDKVSIKRPLITKSPEPSLRYLELQITDKCNLKCRHCYINPPSPPLPEADKGGMGGFELPVKQIENVLYEFEEMQGLRVLITGGEPLLHSRFREINKILPEFFMRKVLFTNSLLLDKGLLKNLNVDEIQISVDGLENAHDSLRDKGTFKKTMDSIKLSIDSGFEVSISTMVHSRNLEDFDEMEKLFKGLGIKDWAVDVPGITGRLEENTEFQISPEKSGKYLRYGYGNMLHTGAFHPGGLAEARSFGCGLHLMSVLADGRVSKCTFYSDRPVGKIEDGLRTCWQRINPVRLDELKCDCEHIESCRGGCRYRAELFGDPLGKDLYRCAFYE